MFLEELVGAFVSLAWSSITQPPPIRREDLQREENLEPDGAYNGLIHREYEQEAATDMPYYEEDTSVLLRPHDHQPRRNVLESLLRSCKANVGFLMAAVFMLGFLTAGSVFLDLNTTNACKELMTHNLTVPSNIRMLQIVGESLAVVAFYTWFPLCVGVLWGLKEFKKNYLPCLLVCQLVTGSISLVFSFVLFDKKINVDSSHAIYRLPSYFIFIFSILCGAYLVARKLKQVNAATSYTLCHIRFILSFSFLEGCLMAYIYIDVVVNYFKETEDRIKKAILAAIAPGIVFPVTAITKYVILRKSSEVIAPDRAFVLCYFLRGATIIVYRTMQSDFQNIWLFIALSLLHGVSNVLSKATLNFRLKIWKTFIKYLNKTNCGPRLQVRPLNSPRIRRFNADLEIQNILFEYVGAILSQAYLACYLVMSFDVPAWEVIKGSLTRIAISVAIDFVFNIISVFIQVHFYDIPMRKVWQKCWRRHVTATAFMIICVISLFSKSLVSVMMDHNYMMEGYELRNCTSVF